MSFAVFVNLFGAGILTLFVPELTNSFQTFNGNGQSSLLGIFVGLNVLSLLLIFFFVPETAGATLGKEEGSLNYISLEELNYIFGVSTIKHISYQLRHMVPWMFNRLVWRLAHPFSRDSQYSGNKPEELYTWVNVRTMAKQDEKQSKAAIWNQPTDDHTRQMSDDSLEVLDD